MPQRIDIYDEISFWGVGAQRIVEQLKAAGTDDIEVHINSPGGDVFEGFAIANALRAYKGRKIAIIDGLCASAATFPAVACDEVVMCEASMFMVHDPWSLAVGSADDMEAQALVLRQLTDLMVGMYTRKTGKDEVQVRAWVSEETWFKPEEAKAAGFCDRIAEQTAKIDARVVQRYAAQWRNPPKFQSQAQAKSPRPASSNPPAAVRKPPAASASPPSKSRTTNIMDRKEIVAGLAAALALAHEYAQAGSENADPELQAAAREILASDRLPACSGFIMPLAQADGADITSDQARNVMSVYAVAKDVTGVSEGVAGALEALGKNAKAKMGAISATLDVQVEQEVQKGIKALKLTPDDGRAWRTMIARGSRTLADLKSFVKVAIPAAENASSEEVHGAQTGADGTSTAKDAVSPIVKQLTDWE